MSIKVFESGTAQFRVVQKLAKHFKLSSSKLNDEVKKVAAETNSPYLDTTPALEELGFYSKFRCVESDHLTLETLLDIEKFKKSKIYAEYCEYCLLTHSIKLAIVLSGTVWLIYRQQNSYAGAGAILLNDPDSDKYFIIEPIEHFLNYWHPVPEE